MGTFHQYPGAHGSGNEGKHVFLKRGSRGDMFFQRTANLLFEIIEFGDKLDKPQPRA